MYPPHFIALGSIYLSSLLLSFEQPLLPSKEGETSPAQLASILNQHLDWETKFKTKAEDLDDIAHTFLDLLITYTQSSASTNTSPSTPSSPSPHLSRQPYLPQSQLSQQQQQQQHFSPYQYNADQLIRLKIFMRQTEHKPRARMPWGLRSGNSAESDGGTAKTGSSKTGSSNVMGQNEGTTIFSFLPAGGQ